MKQFLTLYFMILLNASLFAQAPDTLWTKTYGGSGSDYGFSVQQTLDGGYIIVGWTDSYGAGEIDIWLIKTHSNGDTLWTKTFGGSDYDYGYSVQQTVDGGYIIVGSTKSFGAGARDVWLIKTDDKGDTLWTKTFGGNDYDDGYSVQQTTDGGYIITGGTDSFGIDHRSDVWLIKTNANGDSIWSKTFGGISSDHGYSIQQTTDHGYIITGSTGIPCGNSYKGGAFLIKTNITGDTLWTKTWAYNESCASMQGNSVKQTNDGGYIVTGYVQAPRLMMLLKTDANGDTLWTKFLVDSLEGNSVQQTSDGGYIVVGNKVSTHVTSGVWYHDICLVKTDADGNVLWKKSMKDIGGRRGSSVQQTTDGSFIITGSNKNRDVLLFKTASDVTSIVEGRKFFNTFYIQQNYPNPFNPATTIRFQIPEFSFVTLKVYDVLGSEVVTLVKEEKIVGNYEIDFNAAGLPSGIYFYKLQAGSFVDTKKMILLR